MIESRADKMRLSTYDAAEAEEAFTDLHSGICERSERLDPEDGSPTPRNRSLESEEMTPSSYDEQLHSEFSMIPC
ncbi:unnamed protein product [Heligmosomoides polygyrus]|uniref:Uncharacterized protein n=1 Tax=Heligmosomoides polygyrus TaxID=6339 RepID=A0A183FPR4_HELPZ|nr:unnamed protein product [Heligmosomoides polygyrus]